jgi:hypothetical protein
MIIKFVLSLIAFHALIFPEIWGLQDKNLFRGGRQRRDEHFQNKKGDWVCLQHPLMQIRRYWPIFYIYRDG